MAAGLISYGFWHFSSQYKLLQGTCFSFAGYKPLALNKDHIKIEISLKLKNQSDLDLHIRGYQFDISINNHPVTTVFSKQSVTVNRRDPVTGSPSFTILPVVIDVNPQTLGNLNFLSGILLNYQEALVKIKGSVSVKTSGILLSHLPINTEKRLRNMIPAIATGDKEPCI